ncbi:hypothetical protein Q4E93_34070 [Flavitalea sp. BT771]|uniref:hypothetical protein n=1 Tax=Flavitalea sp. BT771 TaxID=3063329 RepID=UPI0026E121B0|nr:hypothetical protein [Flavitalea sp. BT771]MDO6435691.1 hypothetical protein [Flavitalea sp. BT771]MDV6224592.1 hypothetical protein [Flavitalea sp. BT771]
MKIRLAKTVLKQVLLLSLPAPKEHLDTAPEGPIKTMEENERDHILSVLIFGTPQLHLWTKRR